MSFDFSLSNPAIRSWFESNEGPAPVREFIYLHEHPLVRPNFISEIEVLIFETGRHILERGIQGTVPKRLEGLAKAFVESLNAFVPGRDETSAMSVLESLRGLYDFCVKVQRM